MAKRKKSGGRKYGGRGGLSVFGPASSAKNLWACKHCFATFPDRGSATVHEVEHHGSAGRVLRRKSAHSPLRSCKWCEGPHTTSQHSSHGVGSHARVHPGGG